MSYAIASNPSTPPATLEALAGRDARCAVAGNPNTPPATLAALAADANWSVRCAVAGNPSTPPATLEALADADWLVRHTVARNPSTSPATLEALLANDADEGVRHAAAGNPSTPFPVAKIPHPWCTVWLVLDGFTIIRVRFTAEGESVEAGSILVCKALGLTWAEAREQADAWIVATAPLLGRLPHVDGGVLAHKD